tara:strand:+ start:30 stop:449 length:420 start_codon:yes stop_codon:yes gene_type:complete
MFLLTDFQNSLSLALVQDGPPSPGEGDTSIIVADSGSSSMSETPQVGPFGDNFFVMLMLILLGMIIFSFLGGRKQKKQRASMLNALKKHDQVLTRGGVFGSVVEIRSDRVVLKVDESSNTRITVLRDSIEQVTADDSGN